MITEKTNHAVEAVAHLLQQFHGKEKLEAFISLLAGQIQDLEAAVFSILEDTPLAVAVGEQLDGIGRLLGTARSGQDDATYRLFLQAKLLIIRSTTDAETVIHILDVLTGEDKTLELTEYPDTDPAAFHIQVVEEVLDADPLVDFLVVAAMLAMNARGAGIKGIVSVRREGAFRFDTVGFGFDQSARFSTSVGDS